MIGRLWVLSFLPVSSSRSGGFCSTPSGRINYLSPRNPQKNYASSESNCTSWCSESPDCQASTFLTGPYKIRRNGKYFYHTNCLFYGPVNGEDYSETRRCMRRGDDGMPCPDSMKPFCTQSESKGDAIAHGISDFDLMNSSRCGSELQTGATCGECHAQYDVCEEDCVMTSGANSKVKDKQFCFQCSRFNATPSKQCLENCNDGTPDRGHRCELRQQFTFTIELNVTLEESASTHIIENLVAQTSRTLYPLSSAFILQNIALESSGNSVTVVISNLAQSQADEFRRIMSSSQFRSRLSHQLYRNVGLTVSTGHLGRHATLLESIGTIKYAPKHDFLDPLLFGGVQLFQNLPPSCFVSGADTQAYHHLVAMENSEDLVTLVVSDAGLDGDGQSQEITVASTVKAHFSTGRRNYFKGIRFQVVSGVRRHSLDPNCALFSLLNPTVSAEFAALPLRSGDKLPGKQDRDRSDQGKSEFLEFWGAYNRFFNSVGSHAVSAVHTGARFQVFFSTVSEDLSVDILKNNLCSWGQRVGINVGDCSTSNLTAIADGIDNEFIINGGKHDQNVELNTALFVDSHPNPEIAAHLDKFLLSVNESNSAIQLEWHPIWTEMQTLANTIADPAVRRQMQERARNLETFYTHWLYKFDKPSCEELMLRTQDPKITEECLCGAGTSDGYATLCSGRDAICHPAARQNFGACYENCANRSRCTTDSVCDDSHFAGSKMCLTPASQWTSQEPLTAGGNLSAPQSYCCYVGLPESVPLFPGMTLVPSSGRRPRRYPYSRRRRPGHYPYSQRYSPGNTRLQIIISFPTVGPAIPPNVSIFGSGPTPVPAVVSTAPIEMPVPITVPGTASAPSPPKAGKNCLGGSMKLVRSDGSVSRVDTLTNGDVLRGVKGDKMEASTCNILAIHKVGVNHTMDHLTADHFVLDSDGVSRPYSSMAVSPVMAVEPIYTLVSTCDAVESADALKVTPFSAAFCDRALTWKENVELAGALRDSLDVAPWLNLNIYVDTPTQKWSELLNPLCDAMLQCLEPEDCEDWECAECQNLKMVFSTLVRDHVKPRYQAGIRSYCLLNPDWCNPDAQPEQAIVTHLVRQNRLHHVIGVTMGFGIVVLAVLGCFVFKWRRRLPVFQQERTAEPDMPAEQNI